MRSAALARSEKANRRSFLPTNETLPSAPGTPSPRQQGPLAARSFGIPTIFPLLFLNRTTRLLLELPERPPFIGCRVSNDPIDLTAFVVFGEVLGDGKTFRIAKEQSVAVLPLLHLIARADPGRGLNLFRLIFVKITRAERPTELINMLGEADHQSLSDLGLGV